MHIIVCIKQVPDTEAQIQIKSNGSEIIEDNIKWIMNPYDEFAVEEALRLKEKFTGEITIISVGPNRVNETIRTALAMGADKGIHINDPLLYNVDSYTIALALAAVIKNLTYEIILCGQKAIDDDAGLVGGILADILDIPQITVVTKIDIINNSILRAVKPIENAQLTVETLLPCLITAQKGLNEPRYASLPGIMKAKKKEILVKNLADIGILAESKTKIRKIIYPPKRAQAKIIEAENSEQKALKLCKLLREEAKVI